MEISPEKWREASIHGIKLAQVIIKKSDEAVNDGRINEPLPLLREFCIQQSNDKIRAYMRATRAVVVKLRRSLAAVNDEMKSANRCKESLEKALEYKRKDLVLNLESQGLRSHRPLREKELDTTDKLLSSERCQLLSSKRALEAQLCKVQVNLQELGNIRSCLAAVVQERSRVSELLCQAISFTQGPHTPRNGKRLSNVSLRNSSSPSQCSTCSSNSERGSVESRPLTRSSACSSRQKAHSAPLPLELGKGHEMEDIATVLEQPDPSFSGPYDALSAEAIYSLNAASEAVLKSREIRQEAVTSVDRTHQLQQAAHDTIHESFIKKIAHTVTLTDHLALNSGETRLSYQRSTRHYNAQQKTLGYLLGPLSSAGLNTRERLDRPVVTMYQRHVGRDVPEATHLIQATDQCNDSMDTTIRNMALLKLASKGLEVDIGDKRRAALLDSSAVRLRRRKADHRWVLKGKAYTTKSYAKRAVRSLSQ